MKKSKKELLKKEKIKIKCPFCKEKIPSNSLRCSHCTADLSGKETQDKIQKQLRNRRKNKIIKRFVWLGIIVLFFVLILVSDDTPNTDISKEAIQVNIRTAVLEKKNDPYSMILIIENKNSFNWGDCELKLNGDFKKKMATIKTGDNRVPIINFTKKDGTFFDIRKYTYTSFEVQCKKPYFDVQKYKI